MASELKVLIVEDVATDAEMAARELKRAGVICTTRRVDTAEAFLQQLEESAPDVILCDFSLPHFDGLSALDITRRKLPDVPFVFLSGTIGEERAVEAMKRGATDYVLKDRLQRLAPVVTRAVQEAKERAGRRKAERELEITSSRLDTIVASLVDVVWSASLSPHQLLYVSPAIERIYQRSTSEFYANPTLWLEVIHPDDREEVSRLWNEAIASGRAFDAEYRVVLPDGGIRWIHDRGTPVPDEAGAVIRIDGLASDVTPRRLQQEKIARLSRIREVLSGINAAIVRTRDRGELFQEACRIAVEHGQFRMAWIGLAEPEGRKVKPVAWKGHEEGYLEEVGLSLREVAIDPGTARRALDERRPVVANDIVADSTVVFKREALARGYRSLVVLPLLVDAHAVGTLNLYAAEVGFFDQEEMMLLTELAADIAFALAYIEKEEKLNYLAYYDVLTGLSNRHLLQVRLTQEIGSAQHRGQMLAVVFIDLDNFKLINDGLGHHTGDLLLKAVGERLTGCVREEGTVARGGGDEFVIVLPKQTDDEGTALMLQRILATVAEPLLIEEQEFHLTCSIGVSLFPRDGPDADTLLKNAGTATHRTKELGRNAFLFYGPEMDARTNERLLLESRLRRAIEQDELFLNYQPQIDLHTGTIVGVEALLRWKQADLGLVSPGRFIPIAEETGLIVPIGEWVLRTACAQNKKWQDEGLPPFSVAVNLSARQFRQKDVAQRVAQVLQETGLAARFLELELTESLVMHNTEAVIGTLKELNSMRLQLAIDDFGTGYSSLSYLKRFPVDRLKIDQSFVRDIATDPDDAAIAQSIIALGHSLDLKVIAEGVETAEQLAFLKNAKCDEAQGYFFSKPVLAGEIKHFLARGPLL